MLVRRLLAVAILIAAPLCWHTPASAQNAKNWTVTACGTAPNGFSPGGTGYTVGAAYPQIMDVNGNLCIGGTFIISPTGAAAPYQGTAIVGGDQLGLATASATSLTVPTGALYCVVTTTLGGATPGVNWRADGTSPSTGATGGQPFNQGGQLTFSGPMMRTVQFVNQTASSGAVINVSYFK